MLNFLRALSGASEIENRQDNIIFDDVTQYVYLDFGSTSANRKVVKAPSVADDVSYDNTESGATASNVQDAIDELFECLSNIPSELSWTFDDVNEAVLITGAVYDDVNECVTISDITYSAVEEAFTV